MENEFKFRKAGAWEGKVEIADDFDELPPEIMKRLLQEDA